MIHARFMIRPLEGGVSDQDQDQCQGGAHSAADTVPRRSERLKKKEICLDPVMKPLNSVSSNASTGSIDRKLQRRCNRNQRPTQSVRMPADFPWSMYNGPASQQGRKPYLWSPSLPWRSSSAVGSDPTVSVAPGTVTVNSSPPSHLPLPPGLPPPGLVQSVLRPQAQTFQPSRQPNGSGHLSAGQVCRVPICPPLESCLPSSHFPSSHFPSSLPLSRTTVNRVIQPFLATRSLELTSAISGRSRFVELSDEPEPVVQRQRARRSQTPVPVSASASQSSSRTRFSNVPSGSESEGREKDIVFRSIRKTPTRREQLAFTQTSNQKNIGVVPAQGVKSYNDKAVVSSIPESVYGMRVKF